MLQVEVPSTAPSLSAGRLAGYIAWFHPGASVDAHEPSCVLVTSLAGGAAGFSDDDPPAAGGTTALACRNAPPRAFPCLPLRPAHPTSQHVLRPAPRARAGTSRPVPASATQQTVPAREAGHKEERVK